MSDGIAIDDIDPQTILNKIGGYEMAFALSYKGDGNRDDGNFVDINTSWRPMQTVEIKEIYLELLRRNVASACQQGFNFMEFWHWPEVYARDDGTRRVVSRLRMLRITPIHQPRPN